MSLLAISIKTGQGVPKRSDLNKTKKEKDFYFLGKEAANIEKTKEEAEAKTATADLYSSIIMAQAKMLMNTVMMDIARLLAEVKMQNEMNKAILSQIGLNPTLTPLNTNIPNAPFPPLPINQGPGATPAPFPPLPVGNEAVGAEGLPNAMPPDALPPQGMPPENASPPVLPTG